MPRNAFEMPCGREFSCRSVIRRIYPLFFFPTCRITTSREKIPITAPTETGDCLASGSVEGIEGTRVLGGRVEVVFICDIIGIVEGVLSLALTGGVASRFCSAILLFAARFGYVGSRTCTVSKAAIASS